MGCSQSKEVETKQGTISLKQNSNNTSSTASSSTAAPSSTGSNVTSNNISKPRPVSTKEEKPPAVATSTKPSAKDENKSVSSSVPSTPRGAQSGYSSSDNATVIKESSTVSLQSANVTITPSKPSNLNDSNHSISTQSSKPVIIPTNPPSVHSPKEPPSFIYKHVTVGLILFCRDSFHSKYTGELMHRWREVEIIDIQGPDRSKIFVHFIGWASTFDHWIDLNEELNKVSPIGLLTKDELDKGVGLEPVQLLISKEFFISGRLLDAKVAYQRESKRLSRSNPNSKSQPIETATTGDIITAAKALTKGSQSDRNLHSKSDDSEDGEAHKLFVANLSIGQKVSK